MMEVKMQEPRAQPDKEPVDPVAEKAAVYAAKEKQKMEAPEDKGARTAGGKRKNASCRSYFEPEHPVRKAGKLFAGPGEKRNTRKPDLVRNLRKTAAEAGRTIDSETGGDSGSLEESTVQEGAALAFEGAGIFSSLERNERLQEKNSRFVKENTEPEETKGSILLLFLVFTTDTAEQSIVSGASYQESDANILTTNKAYAELEKKLHEKIVNTPSLYGGYDEYRYDLAEISHNPYDLTSYLSAEHLYYTADGMAEELKEILALQYQLTYTSSEEKRWRDAKDENGNTVYDTEGHAVQEPYQWRILTVKLTKKELNDVLPQRLSASNRALYDCYRETNGGRTDLFGASGMDNNYKVYYEDGAVKDDEIEAAIGSFDAKEMYAVAREQLGKTYVFGAGHGSDYYSGNPAHFDCSSFVSWVIDHSIGHIGCNTTNGILSKCNVIPSSEAQAGDIIFFQHTYDCPGASHVAIYLGNNLMIHCGNPIKITNITSSYWTSHFLCFGRLKSAYRN
jgi:cell wall-associated NlpC family hydrolase